MFAYCAHHTLSFYLFTMSLLFLWIFDMPYATHCNIQSKSYPNVWPLSSACSYNLTFIYFNETTTTDTLCLRECSAVAKGVWSVIDLFLVFVFPCSVIMISYVKILAIARKHAKSIRCSRGQHIPGNKKYGESVSKASERKAATTPVILVIVFVTCLLPYLLCIERSSFIPYPNIGKVLLCCTLSPQVIQ